MSAVELLDNKELKDLASVEKPLCLTLTMPCIQSGDQQQQNSIRFKNLLQKAQEKLETMGCSKEEIDTLVSPLYDYLPKTEFWKNQDKGLLVCMTKNQHSLYGLPFSIDERVIIDRRFYLREIIPYMQDERETALLLLDTNGSKVIFSNSNKSEYDVVTPDEKHLKSFENFKQIYDTEKSLHFRSQGSASGKNSTQAGFHGQGAAGDDATDKAHKEEYFKQFENWLVDVLRHKGLKEIFVVADAQAEGIYKNVTRANHPTLKMLEQINPDSRSVEDWLQHVQKENQKALEKERIDTLSKFEKRKASSDGSVSENMQDIVRAAYNERVEALLLPDSANQFLWGEFDPEKQEVSLQDNNEEDAYEPGDELINLAVIKTYLNGGSVLPLSAEEEQRKEYAAIYRW